MGYSQILKFVLVSTLSVGALPWTGCDRTQAKQPAAQQAMPVKTQAVSLQPVPQTTEYVATIKSRRSANIQPQVDGSITKILVKSGDKVSAGQLLMTIDPLKQEAVVNSQRSTEAQMKATFEYNRSELERQKGLYEAQVASKQTYEQAVSNFENSRAAWESAKAATISQQQQLGYYNLRAPFSGIVGDIPVRIGDYVSSTTLLTTVDENKDLEAYVYIPTDLAGDIRMGLPIQIVTSTGELIETTNIYFVAPQVDNALQGILVKAPIHASLDRFRNAQLVKARVVWSTAPAPTVPVLAVTRIGGQAFVYVAVASGDGHVAKQRAVNLGETIGNNYAVTGGLQSGDQVIISGIQFLNDGVPVQPMS